jgi:hypothetical protein
VVVLEQSKNGDVAELATKTTELRGERAKVHALQDRLHALAA